MPATSPDGKKTAAAIRAGLTDRVASPAPAADLAAPHVLSA